MQEAAATVSRLAGYWKRPRFSAGGHTYQALDAALAAMLRSEWSAFERSVAEGLALHASAEREGTLPPGPTVDAAADAFRYERDLIAADEINAWLERRSLDADEWYGYLGRTWLRQQSQATLDEVLERYPPSTRDLLGGAYVDGVCSGAFDRFERTVAGRAAIALEATSTESSSTHRDVAERVAHTHSHWLAGVSVPAPEVLSRLERLAAIDGAYARIIASLATPERVAEIVELHKMDWRRVETVTLKFASEHAAREAMLCVKTDGLSIYDVAAISRQPAVRRERFFEDLSEDVRDRLLGVDVGALAGPYPVDRSFELSMVMGHHLPAATDASVAARANRVLIETATERAINARVRWAELEAA
jgi:hypothetical protein